MNKKYVRECLVHSIGKRYNRGVLSLLLNNIFRDNATIYEVEEEYLKDNEDYRFDCNCGNINVTIWFAKTRNESQFIVTDFRVY